MAAKLKECPFCGGKAVESEWPEGGETGKVYCLGLGNKHRDTRRGFLRECPIEEKEFDKQDWENRPAIAPPVAAGSVDTIRTMIGTYRHLPKIHSDEAWDARQAHMDAIMNSIAAWGAQQRKFDDEENKALVAELKIHYARAEKAEAELESWVHTNRIDELQRSLLFAGNRIQELESQLSAAKPYDLKA